jgi:hypothetical protein
MTPEEFPMKKLFALVALAALPLGAQAELLASVDAFGSFSKFEVGSSSEDADGYGLRGRVNLPGTGLFGRVQLLEEQQDDTLKTDYSEVRIGGGIATGITPLIDLSLELEHLDLEFKNSNVKNTTDGFGVFGGVSTSLPLLNAYGRIGFMLLENNAGTDVDGTEYLIGARISVLPFVGLFAEYRLLNLDPEVGGDTDIKSYRLGASFSF